MRELYRVLEVEPTADFETIRESYRRLLKRYHPDSGGTAADPGRLDRVVDAFRRVSRVHETRRRTAVRPSTDGAPARGGSRRGERADSGTTRASDLSSVGEMLVSSVGAGSRAFAARTLGNSGKRSAYPYLRRGLRDENETVVISCVRAIGRLRIAHSAGDLSAVFHGAGVEVKCAVMEAVGDIDRLHLFRNLILTGLEDGAPDVRKR
ncbi:MAG: DnaJ domain-containing protein, partial [Spirochaetia bacterium]